MGYYINLLIVIFVFTYINQSLVFFKLANDLNLMNRWLAFIPFLQNILLLRIINKKDWYFILFLVPVVNVIAYVVFYTKFYEMFDLSFPWIIFSIIIWPIGQISNLYIAFFKKELS
ncbi:DUF5684 domain-containing protein [Haloimpatiens sp. FM7315]|uniref:DUF5684 domain-containing protein n=1 Tax=Haloimpatiens sp. FM7315 TaxID=3298609 RepID=UPI003709CCA5